MLSQLQTHIANIRLDVYLSQELGQSRNQIATLIKKIGVKVNGNITHKCGLKLSINDTITLLEQPLKESTSVVGNMDFIVPIIYEDEDILVVNKPSGLTTHRAGSEKAVTLVDWLEYSGYKLSTLSGEDRFGIVHRLDKPTSGLMVVAKNNATHAHLSAQLQNRTMGRYYIAIITPPLKNNKVIDRAVGRNPNNRLLMSAINYTHGKSAKSSFYKLWLSHNSDYELIVAKLFSGRTHQIRVHLQTINRHIVGDRSYGYTGNMPLNGQIFSTQCYALSQTPN